MLYFHGMRLHDIVKSLPRTFCFNAFTREQASLICSLDNSKPVSCYVDFFPSNCLPKGNE